jgi:hypothetical protein
MHHHWVHEYLAEIADIFFLRRRIAFDRIGKPSNPASFGNMIAIYGVDQPMTERMRSEFACAHLPRTDAIGARARGNCAVRLWSNSETACKI